MKKCALIFSLVDEAETKDNAKLREQILNEMKQMVVPYCREITEVVVWTE